MRDTVLIGGVPVLLATDDEHRAIALRRTFGSCPPTDERPKIDLVFGDDVPDVPTSPPDQRFPSLDVWHGKVDVVARQASGVVARNDGTHVTVGGPIIGDKSDHYGAREVRMAAQYGLIGALDVLDVHTIHAGLLERNGRGVMVLGSSGGGKSTLCFAAWKSGWQVLADDLVFVRPGDAAPTCLGLPRRLTVPGDVITSAADGSPIPDDARQRWELRADAVQPAGSCEVVGILVCGHDDGPGRLDPLPPNVSLSRVILEGYARTQAPASLRRFLRVLGPLSAVPSRVLMHDPVPANRVVRAAEMLDEFWTTATDQ